jgi:hypothetical protein
MKWITRERARVDRIACPWLISRFIDSAPEFIFVPARDVLTEAKRRDAIPYDIPDIELGHHGPECSFDAFVDRYELFDPALRALALIVRGADRLYTLINGTRRTLASARVTEPKLGAWHTPRVTATGPRIQAWLDGAALLDHKDTTYTRGFIGLWTKADSVTEFADLTATGAP